MTSARRASLPIATALLIAFSAACTAPSASNQPIATQAAEVSAVTAPTAAPATATVLPSPTPAPAPTEAPTVAPSPEPTATAAPTLEPTPEPTGIDAIAAAFPDAPQAAGDVILLTGKVLDPSGAPIAGAAVEIWHTDAKGIYDHPGDPDTASRDQTFQFYGTSTTDADGTYLFRTIKPGLYEPRPRHIHVKVRIDGAEALTTQFYFMEDRAALGGEGVFRQSGDQGDLLILQEAGSVDMAGRSVPVLVNDLVIDTGQGAGSLPLTPRQMEGPYYPVVAVAEFDNDLTIVP
jgi:protocatechuate 3,4-dioxygenase beta subunit